ncbi:response regulator [Microbacterium sp. VKM Ac-2870]|uniref:response regulator n=1 Tax=Microbacterium sp. VKM Ac-2870 TaxID=2783825 RepID=UPI00188ABD9E|nr:response regulator [Microbacterium sp. VKM Ac-2870]MBF4563188.1 response regulator [Microbacterium sp. VKM Ac-2870]
MTAHVRVLVVDDDFRVAGLHRDIVAERPGYRALEPARTLAEATAAVRAERPDLLLVDAFLPDGDGIAFVRDMGVDAFVLSAATDARTVRRGLRSGALSYLVKPFERRTLTDLLDRYLRFRNILDEERAVSQDDVDRALAILRAGGEAPSVSRSATEQVILEALGDAESSASEIADRAGVSRATAQRHLSAMAGRGVVDVRLRYGTTGRPEHRYLRARS